MINNVVLAGRITKDPELKKTPTETSVVSFTLAVNRKSTQANGPQADFVNCVAWRQSADFMANYVKQGDLLGTKGRLQVRSYKDQQDRTVYVTEVVCDSVQILARKQATQGTNAQTQTNTFAQKEQTTHNGYEDFTSNTIDVTSEDLPF